MPVIPMVPGKDMLSKKEERLEICSQLFEAGKVFLPEGKTWVKDVVNELTNFPNAHHDDIVDSISQYLSKRLGFPGRPRVRRL
jgi:predicted phage terminase large subunit-like protein